MLISTLGYSASNPSSRPVRKPPIPPSPDTQNSSVTGSPELSSLDSDSSPLPLQAAATSDMATSPTNARRHFIRTLLTSDRREAPPIFPRPGRTPPPAPPYSPILPTAGPWAHDNVPRSVR